MILERCIHPAKTTLSFTSGGAASMNCLRSVLSSRTIFVLTLTLTLSALIASRTISAQSGLYVSTFAGGFDDGQGASARLNAPLGIAMDKDDNLIVADFRNARIRKIDPQGNVT